MGALATSRGIGDTLWDSRRPPGGSALGATGAATTPPLFPDKDGHGYDDTR